MAGGAGAPRKEGHEAQLEKETGGDTLGRGQEGAVGVSPGGVAAPRSSQLYAEGRRQPPGGRLPTLGGPRAAGAPPLRLVFLSSPPPPPSLPPCLPAWDGRGSREHPAGLPGRAGWLAPAPVGRTPRRGAAVSGARSRRRR